MPNSVTSTARFQHGAKARQEGYSAGGRGLKRKDNPYPVPSYEALAWEHGRSDHLKKSRRRGKGLQRRDPTSLVGGDKPCD